MYSEPYCIITQSLRKMSNNLQENNAKMTLYREIEDTEETKIETLRGQPMH